MTTRALSIMQPWAALIVSGIKPVENRTWTTRYRGPILIHAGLKLDREAMDDLARGIHPVTGEKWNAPTLALQFGGIVGEAEIIDCVDSHASEWFVGPYGFVLANARTVQFQPYRGALGLFVPAVNAPKLPAHQFAQQEMF